VRKGSSIRSLGWRQQCTAGDGTGTLMGAERRYPMAPATSGNGRRARRYIAGQACPRKRADAESTRGVKGSNLKRRNATHLVWCPLVYFFCLPRRSAGNTKFSSTDFLSNTNFFKTNLYKNYRSRESAK
jgi:hypothetical protein